MTYPAYKKPVRPSGEVAFVHHGLCFLRVPFFPVEYLSQLHTIAGAGLEKGNLFTDPAFLEALFLGSRDLYGQYRKYLQGTHFSERIARKLFGGIERYFIRMCSRCTPYGLFAGYKIGSIGEATRVALGTAADYRRHIHLDMHAIMRLARHIQALPEVRHLIRYFPNNSLYRAGDRLRYVETANTHMTVNYRISAVNASPFIEAILHRAETGGRVADLAASITDEDIPAEEARTFVDTLIDNQLLVSELEPEPSGGDVFGDLLSALSFLPAEAPLMERLRAVERLLKSPLPGVQSYERIADLLADLLPDVDPASLTYTDLERTGGEAVIQERLILEIQDTINHLWPIFLLEGNEYLKRWKEAFTEKFDNREIPLVIALDPELGIGYRDHDHDALTETPLLDDLDLGENTSPEEFRWSRLLKWKNRKLKEALFKREAIVITDEDLQKVAFHDIGLRLPENVYTMGSILAASGEEADRGNYFFALDTCFGPGSASLLSRFANGDAAFALKLRECAEREEAGQPDKIFAEIVHLPETRSANMVLRPPLRPYEIAYLARPAVGAEYQIPVSDLLVSCVAGKVVLRSSRLSKEIVPRLTASHNYMSTDLPIYKFLCDLQLQHSNAAIVWDWEVYRDDTYLPRVIYKNILLCPATWNIDYDDLGLNGPGLDGPVLGRDELFAVYGRIRRELGMPAKVMITSNDQKLFIDLEDEAYLRLFHQHFRKNRRLKLQEFLFDPGNCLVKGKEGSYAHELIIPFSQSKEVPDVSVRQGEAEVDRVAGAECDRVVGAGCDRLAGAEVVPRDFAPGSEWLFLKLYSGRVVAERLVRECLGPLAEELRREGLITKWFFIRYADPKPHLRLRFFHPTDASFWQRVMERVNGIIVAGAFGDGMKLQYDTYERELSRYGYERIGLSESLFYHDSEAVVRMTGLFAADGGETLRWLVALRNIDALLGDFQLDLPGRHRLMEALKNDYLQEFKVGKEGISRLDQQYRDFARRIAGILDEGQDKENGMEQAGVILGERSAKNNPVIQELSRTGIAGSPMFVASHVHMAMNRLLVVEHRKQEMALYYLLWRTYASRLGFVKYNT